MRKSYSSNLSIRGYNLGDKIAASDLSQRSKLGYAGFTQPLMWNLGGNLAVPLIMNITKF